MNCKLPNDLADAARTLSSEPAGIQLRYLQTLAEIAGNGNNSTTIFPVPIDLVGPFVDHFSEKRSRRNEVRWEWSEGPSRRTLAETHSWPRRAGRRTRRLKQGRGATGRIVNYLVLFASIGVLGAWAWQGVYNLKPGEAAVILRFGAFDRIQLTEGLAFHLPPPLESHHVVNTGQERSESFGARQTRTTEGTPADAEEAEISRKIERDAIQTADNNIVNVSV